MVMIKGILAVILAAWIAVGAIAANYRGYLEGTPSTCARAGTIAATLAAGPLNYFGVDPKITCTVPQPST
jgi:hypothetical protein